MEGPRQEHHQVADQAGPFPKGILRDYGELRGSIHHQYDNDELRIGSPVKYAAIHQLGGTIDMPEREQKLFYKRERNGQIGRRFAQRKKADHTVTVQRKAHQITITARPFLGLSEDDKFEIWEAVGRWLNP